MNSRLKLFVSTILVIVCAGGAFSAGASQIDAAIDTYVVRPAPSVAAQGNAPAPATLLGASSVGERFCNALHCVVLSSTSGQRNALEALERQGLISVEAVPDAHSLLFQKSRYDAATQTFARDFPGRFDVNGLSEMAQVVVVFKSYPERSWLDQLEALGVVALEPVPVMGYTVYGPRNILTTLGKQFSFVYSVAEIPAGLKRFNVDDPPQGDDGAPALTTVTMVTKTRGLITSLMNSASGGPPALVYRSGTSEAYVARLPLADAYGLSALPEVLSVSRETVRGGPSDERSNRIVAGDFQTPGTSWPATLPSNTSPYYWDRYLGAAPTGLGLDLSHQVIGFLDTGVDGGLQQAGQPYCPPHLRTPLYNPSNPTDPNGCRLVFTTDVTTRFSEPVDARADDRFYHGTFTTSIAAGFRSTDSSGRDGGGYAFTQGVAQNAKVAMCQLFQLCGSTMRSVGEANPFNAFVLEQSLRYALVEMGSTSSLPDTGTGPGARIFNHSWNSCVLGYEATSIILDQTTRSLAMAYFNFDQGQYTGPPTSALHVVSAGNFPGQCPPPADTDRQVTAPAVAKNAIAVGASETYNQEGFTAFCTDNDSVNADNPHQVPGFSRFGYPNQRLKPDLVAPGTRSYGRRSVEWVSTCPGTNPCNMDLDGSSQYGWDAGTSFAAPVVTGAAAIVREWLPTLGFADPSPALVKATLINSARSLTNSQSCFTGCGNCCPTCGDMRPAPDQYQGWGGVSLDRLFRPASNYFFYDQGPPLTGSGQYYSRTVTIADVSKDVNITLAWTDRFSLATNAALTNLVNDLDLYAIVFNGGQGYTWIGNDYYYSRDACTRDGYSLRNPSPAVYDRKNNVERINIRASDIPVGTTSITIQVVAYSLTGDGIDPANNSTFRQDFALAVENAN